MTLSKQSVRVERLSRLIVKASKADDKAIEAQKQRHEQLRKEEDSILLAALIALLLRARGRVLRNVHRYYRQLIQLDQLKDAAEILNFNLTEFQAGFDKTMSEHERECADFLAQSLADEHGLSQPDLDSEFMDDLLASRADVLLDTPQSIHDQIGEAITKAVADQPSLNELIGRIKKEFHDIESSRALLIAKTEAQALYGAVQMFLMRSSKRTMKRWQSMDDEKVRDSHNEAEDEGPIPLEQKFSNGLMFPGDPTGGPEEVCNCRCVLLPA